MVDILSKKFSSPSRIIVAPLNWGLGHATRIYPLIKELIVQGHTVSIASDGAALTFLKQELDPIQSWDLPGYNISYPYNSMVVNMLLQGPGLFSAISKEHRVIQKIVGEWNPDVIISDNRYGCFNSSVKSIFVSHQIKIQTSNALFTSIASKWNQRRITNFDECWIPDYENEPSLAGKLSHDYKLQNVTYIGPLSRMIKKDLPVQWDIIAVLSGPEPQRTILERGLIQELEKLKDKKVLVVRGLIGEGHPSLQSDHVSIVNFMNGKPLNNAVNASNLVISRSGYSSIMDWAALNKRAILIPTPGQPEQEYLARLHNKTKYFRSILQNNLSNLENLIEKCL